MAETNFARVLICIRLFETIQCFFEVHFNGITIYSMKQYENVLFQLKNGQLRRRKNLYFCHVRAMKDVKQETPTMYFI